MNVVNEPGIGHENFIKLGPAASAAVFTQGASLHNDYDHVNKFISSGDGAWIMQKCAKTMGGECDIKFEKSSTVFTFRCPAEPLKILEWNSQEFAVDEDTWAIAVDDSRIQRKLMSRMMAHAGVDESRRLVIGETAEDIHGLESVLKEHLKAHPSSKLLVLVDENLDYGDSQSDQVVLSGSAIMKEILDDLPAEDEARICALVRSANDSADDVALYLSRCHGFFPKAPMQRERVLEILAPLWAERFLAHKPDASVAPSARVSEDPSCHSDEDSFSVGDDDVLTSFNAVDTLVGSDEVPWPKLWSSLHNLKGDLMVFEPSRADAGQILREIIASIGKMKGPNRPGDFAAQWGQIKSLIEKELLPQAAS